MTHLRAWEAAVGEAQGTRRVFWFITNAVETLTVTDANMHYSTLWVR